MKSDQKMRLWLCILINIFLIKKIVTITTDEMCLAYLPKNNFRYGLVSNETGAIIQKPSETLEFVMNHVDVLEFANSQHLVFVMGTEKAEDKMLISFITGAELKSMNVAGKITIVDVDGKLKEYPHYIEPKLVPLLIRDRELGITYYLLPKYNATANVKYDLTATHLTERLLKYATNIKILLVCSNDVLKHDDETDSILNRKEIFDLILRVSNTIIDVEKFMPALSLVVTGIQDKTGTSEDQLISRVAHILRLVYIDYKHIIEDPNVPEKEKEQYEKGTEIIELLVNRDSIINGIVYTRLNILREPDKSGPLENNKILQKEKIAINAMILNDTDYIASTLDDFSLELKQSTVDHLPEVSIEIKKHLTVGISNLNSYIQNVYIHRESKNSDLETLLYLFTEAYKVISNILADDLTMFVEETIIASKLLQFELSQDDMDYLLMHIELIDFIASIQNIHPPNINDISNGLSELLNYLSDSIDWYSFLINTNIALSEYSVQQNVTGYNIDVQIVMQQCSIERGGSKNTNDIGLKQFLDKVDTNLFPQVENRTMNSFKLEHLSAVLEYTMKDYGAKYCSPDILEFRGYNVKLSDFVKLTCPYKITFKSIFAQNKIFIDADIDETGNQTQLAIISPIWEIIGNKTIILSGAPAKPYNSSAADGVIDNIKGSPGLPGMPGGSSGCFMAIGKEYINSQGLSVYLNGGTGMQNKISYKKCVKKTH